jgi:hypothetical protein
MNKVNQNLGVSRRDNVLVESEIFGVYHRPVEDEMWVKGNNYPYSLNQDSRMNNHKNHLNQMNHSLDRERVNGRKNEWSKLQAETCSFVYSFVRPLIINQLSFYEQIF